MCTHIYIYACIYIYTLFYLNYCYVSVLSSLIVISSISRCLYTFHLYISFEFMYFNDYYLIYLSVFIIIFFNTSLMCTSIGIQMYFRIFQKVCVALFIDPSVRRLGTVVMNMECWISTRYVPKFFVLTLFVFKASN